MASTNATSEEVPPISKVMMRSKPLRFATAAAKLSPQALVTDLRHAQARLAPLSGRLQPAYRRLVTQRIERFGAVWKLVESLSYKGVLGEYTKGLLPSGDVSRWSSSASPWCSCPLRWPAPSRIVAAS